MIKRNLGWMMMGAWILPAVVGWWVGRGEFLTPLLVAFRSGANSVGYGFLYLLLGWRLAIRLCDFPGGLHREPLIEKIKMILMASGLGMGLLAVGQLGWGIWVGVSWTKTVCFYLLAVGLGLCSIRSVYQELGSVIREIGARIANDRLILGVLLVLLTSLPFALTPTVFPDVLRYHFGLTKRYLDLGAIRYIHDFAESNISSNWQMLLMGPLILSGEMTAQWIHWFLLMGVVVGVMVMSETRMRGWVLAILLSTPFFFALSVIANNDMEVTWIAVLMVMSWSWSKVRHPWLAAGIFAGFGMGTKYSFYLCILSLIFAWIIAGTGSRRLRFKPLFTYLGTTGVFYLPWGIKNIVWTGDPFYPTLSAWLPWGLDAGKEVLYRYSREMVVYGGGMEGWQRWALAPWRLTVESSRFIDTDAGFMIWVLIPLLLWSWYRSSRDSTIRIWITMVLGYVMLWAMGPQVGRFLAPILPIMALGGGWSLAQMQGGCGRLLKVFCVLIMCIQLWLGWMTCAQFSNPVAFFLSGRSRQNYLEQYDASNPAQKWLKERGHEQDRILLIGVEDVFRFRNPIQMSGPFDRKWIEWESSLSGSASELRDRIWKAGVKWIYLDHGQAVALEKKFGYFNWGTGDTEKRFSQMILQYTKLEYTHDTVATRRELRSVIPPGDIK